ncbi:hypothetical protein [Salipiger sp.]|uniref:hypothetical protein n=1 Tax=Salipiger sp. TaxID=2078585 RepID=UPI003A975714
MAEDCFVDRIEITIGDWGLFGSDREVTNQVHRLRDAEVFDVNGETLPLFRSIQAQSSRGKIDASFATSRDDDKISGRTPLISGHLEKSGRFRRYETLQGAELQFCFACTLNLTRWVQAQGLKRVTRLNRPKIASEYVMAIDPDPAWYADERPLVPSTNIVIGGLKRYGYAKGYPLEYHFANYLRATSRTLHRAITQLPLDGQRQPLRERYYAIREIEFYWEFDHTSPISYVWNVIRPALGLSERCYVGSRDTSEGSAEIYGQSPNVKVMLAKGAWLRVYAKTDRRVRFEILLESSAIEKVSGPRGGNSFQSIARKLGDLRAYATLKLNEVLPTLNQGPPAPTTATALLLMSEIQRASPDHHLAEIILSALVAFGRIAPLNNDPVRDTVDRLKDAGVLEPVRRRSRICVVTAEYRAPLDQLRQLLRHHSSVASGEQN